MTARKVALHTDDRRLAAAVASFSEQAALQLAEVPLFPPGPCRIAVLDLRKATSAAVSPWVEAGVAVVAIVGDLGAADDALRRGARDVALSDAEVPLRAGAALLARGDESKGAALRKLVRHDVRSPLAVILGQCEILGLGLGGPLTDKQRKSVEAVERKAHELRVMLERLATDLAEVFGWEADTRSGGPSARG